MKTERRHELQTNDLADLIGKWIEAARPYRTLIVGVPLVLIVLLSVWTWMTANSREAQEVGWQDFFRAENNATPEEVQKGLEDVSNQHTGTEAGLWADQVAGDFQLSRGLQDLFTDRALAETALKSAKDKYQFVLSEVSDSPKHDFLRHRATFGLAQAHEGLSEVDDAVKYYKQVEKDAGNSVLGQQAGKRAAMLADNKMKRWYGWFGRQTPRPPGTTPTIPGLEGTLPGLDDIPDFPDLGTGSIGSPGSGGTGGTPGLGPGFGTGGSGSETGTDLNAPETNTPETNTPDSTPGSTTPDSSSNTEKSGGDPAGAGSSEKKDNSAGEAGAKKGDGN